MSKSSFIPRHIASEHAASQAKARLKAMKFFKSPGCVGIRTVWEKGDVIVVVRFANPTFAELCPARVEGVEVRREIKATGVYSI